jgi:uncharacterized membrane protein
MDKLWFVVSWLHLLGAMFFVGGQLMLAAVIVPVLRGNDRASLRAIARRFGFGTLIAFALLIATGVPMAFHFNLWGDGTFQAKLGLVVLAAGLIFAHMRKPDAHALDGALFLASLAIVWLGLYLANGWS